MGVRDVKVRLGRGAAACLAFVVTACGTSTAPRHTFEIARERSRGEAFAIRLALANERESAAREKTREPTRPAHCTEVEDVAPPHLSCVVRFDTATGSDTYTVTVGLNPTSGAMSVKRDLVDLSTTFNP
jgi:hypothetical protein